VHESSLSPCIHCIIASEIGYTDRAYEFYLRTSRLDLDNYNNDTDDGLHITSMAGTWMSIVHGFGGMKVKDGVLNFSPFIPSAWTKYSFRFLFREHLLLITVSSDNITLEHIKGGKFTLKVYDNNYEVDNQETIIIKR
jgi:maltose phosphorylase